MTARRHGGRANATGRSKARVPQFMPIPAEMARSEAWRSLSGPAAKVYVELRSRYNGANNGDLSLSLDEAARLLGIGKATAQRALAELVEKGFLRVSKPGQWYGRLATTYFTTDRPAARGESPTNDWRQWRAPRPKPKIASSVPLWSDPGADRPATEP